MIMQDFPYMSNILLNIFEYVNNTLLKLDKTVTLTYENTKKEFS